MGSFAVLILTFSTCLFLSSVPDMTRYLSYADDKAYTGGRGGGGGNGDEIKDTKGLDC